MDNEEKIEKVESAISDLEELKEIIRDESNRMMESFMGICPEAVLGDGVPYELRCRLLDLYPEFTKNISRMDEWYAFSDHGQDEFNRALNEIRLRTENTAENTDRIRNAKLIYLLDGGDISLSIGCKVNTDTHEIFDIDTLNPMGLPHWMKRLS